MPYQVLIVDDSKTVRIMLNRLLAMAGEAIGRVQEAENGQDALALMRQGAPDLVLADLNMDGMSGMEMIEAMRSEPGLAGLPVVVISSEGNEAVIEQLASYGVREFIRKPFDLAGIQKMLDRMLPAAA